MKEISHTSNFSVKEGVSLTFRPLVRLLEFGARLRGRTATQRSKKGSEKVLGEGFSKEF